MLVRGQPNSFDGPTGQQRLTGSRQVRDQPALLLELAANHRGGRRHHGRLVVIALDLRRCAAVEQRLRALREQGRRVAGVYSRACAREQHFLHVAVGKGSLPRRNPDRGALVLLTSGLPDRQRHARNRYERDRREDRRDHRATLGRERVDGSSPAHRYSTTSVLRMPEAKWPYMLQNSS
jgi:hypothetical protein